MPLKIGDPLPSLEGATSWFNTSGAPDAYRGGSPLLVHFWSVSCYLCKGNFPALRALKEQYAPKGLKVIAVHMPRQEEDTNVDAVQECINQFELIEPCAVDNAHALKESFKNEQGWVPAYFLFDADGKLRGRSAGEAGISVLSNALQRLFPAEA